jgi:5-methyltetrahydropteroyltriglutamate--homocysteine methyltransferase
VLIRNQEVILPTTMVGSYPRPNWMTGKIFGEYDEPDYINYRAKEDFEDAVRLCIDDQLRAGIDVICDGQQYYESETTHEYGQVFHFWGHHLRGFKRWGDPIAIDLYKRFHAPAVVADIEWVRPIYAPVADMTRGIAGDRPTKIAVQGPLFLAFCCTDRHYGDMKSLAMAIARAFNEEFKDLAARGVDWIQVHEPLTYYGEESWYIDVLNTAFADVDAYKVWHICYGNQSGNPGVDSPRGQDMFPFAFDANVDQIHIETMRRGADDLQYLAGLPAHMDLGVGVIDVKSFVIEKPEAVAARLIEAARHVPAERICVSTDCGMLNLKREHAQRKLIALVEGAGLARAQLSGS